MFVSDFLDFMKSKIYDIGCLNFDALMGRQVHYVCLSLLSLNSDELESKIQHVEYIVFEF